MWKSDFHMDHVEIGFLVISAIGDFTNFLKMYGNLSMAIAYTNSYRNIFSSQYIVMSSQNITTPDDMKTTLAYPCQKFLQENQKISLISALVASKKWTNPKKMGTLLLSTAPN